MNFADMMKLQWKDISDDRIYYTRSKTKPTFRSQFYRLFKKYWIIIKTYQAKQVMFFQYCLEINMTSTQLENRKEKDTKTDITNDLKEIAALCEIEKPVSSYVARHSYANCLKQKGIATDIISESMGHQNIAITQAYLKELDNSLIDEAMEVFL